MITYKEMFRLDQIESESQWKEIASVLTPLLQLDAAFNEGRCDEPLFGYEKELCRHLSHLVQEYVYWQSGSATFEQWLDWDDHYGHWLSLGGGTDREYEEWLECEYNRYIKGGV
jgi:hypothetical protein